MLSFILGVIVGLMIRDIKFQTLKQYENAKRHLEKREKTSFLEATPYAEKYQNAQSIDDVLK